LVYPKGRYHAPVLLDPAAFGWKRQTGTSTPATSASGDVYKKNLGVFSERETTAEIWKLEKGARLDLAERDAVQLFFVLSGEGQAGGQHWERESALRLQSGTGVILTTSSEVQFLRLVLPMLPEAESITNGNGI